MTKKTIYTATLNQAGSDFFVVEGDGERGVYIGTRIKATEELLGLYHAELKSKGIDLPRGDGFVTILRRPVYGDVFNQDSGISPQDLLQVIYDHRATAPWQAGNKRKKADLFYVGKDFAGLIHQIQPILSAWDREIIGLKAAEFLYEHCGRLYHYFNGYEVDYIHKILKEK